MSKRKKPKDLEETGSGTAMKNYNLTMREQAQELAKQSPDTSKLIAYNVDDRTTIYFKPGTSVEKIKQRIELYKKSLLDAEGRIFYFDGEVKNANGHSAIQL